MNRWYREENPELWDALDGIYEDPERRFHTDEWCEEHRERALANFDSTAMSSRPRCSRLSPATWTPLMSSPRCKDCSKRLTSFSRSPVRWVGTLGVVVGAWD